MSQIKTKFIADSAITNTKAAQMPAHTFKGNNTGSTANAIDLTATQLTAELNLFTSGLQGLVPASGGGTTNFLRADGTFAAPPSASGFATTALDNLASVQINASLEFDTTAVYNVGGTGFQLNQVWTSAIVSDGGIQIEADAGSIDLSVDQTSYSVNVKGVTAAADLRFYDDNASNYIALKSPSVIGTNFSLALPSADGNANDVMITDGAGNLSFSPATASAISKKELFVLSGTDITNQYIDLTQVAETDSIDFQIKGSGVSIEGASYDYSVSYTGGAGGKTRITFLNDLATGGPSALVAADVVVIKYAY
jgi:hypothetical protein